MVPSRYGEDEVHLHTHWDTETCKNDQLDQELTVIDVIDTMSTTQVKSTT